MKGIPFQGDPPNPSGLCMCGCGQKTRIARQGSRATGDVRGEHKRYLVGHCTRIGKSEYLVDKETGCWVWQRGMSAGYGHAYIPKDGGGYTQISAHRMVYQREVRPLSKDEILHHKCGNKACVNPEHMHVTSHSDHRRTHGKLTISDGDVIRTLRAAGTTNAYIAKLYKISPSYVSLIVSGDRLA